MQVEDFQRVVVVVVYVRSRFLAGDNTPSLLVFLVFLLLHFSLVSWKTGQLTETDEKLASSFFFLLFLKSWNSVDLVLFFLPLSSLSPLEARL